MGLQTMRELRRPRLYWLDMSTRLLQILIFVIGGTVQLGLIKILISLLKDKHLKHLLSMFQPLAHPLCMTRKIAHHLSRPYIAVYVINSVPR